MTRSIFRSCTAKPTATSLVLAIAAIFSHRADAAEFDAQGRLVPTANYIDFEDFDDPARYVPEDAPVECKLQGYKVAADATALSGANLVVLHTSDQCQERFLLTVPLHKAAYRASVWLRHGSLGARLVAVYPDQTGKAVTTARLAPTGRATSDGWVELASNEMSIDGTLNPRVYLRVSDFANAEGGHIDALELVESGSYREDLACELSLIHI